MPSLDRKHRTATPYLSIVVGSYTLTNDDLMLVRSVVVEDERGKPDKCTITFSDPLFQMADNPMFGYGEGVLVTCGWTDEAILKGPFTIIKHIAQYPESGDVTFAIECRTLDVSHMNVRAQSKNHRGKRSSEIVKEIADKYGLALVLDMAPVDDVMWSDDNGLVQSGETDARFLQRLCDRIGYDWSIVNNRMVVQRPDKVRGTSTILEYRTGRRTLKSFSPELKTHALGGKTGGKKRVSGMGLFDTILDGTEDPSALARLAASTGLEVGVRKGVEFDEKVFDTKNSNALGSYFGPNSDGGKSWIESSVSQLNAIKAGLDSVNGGGSSSGSSGGSASNSKQKGDRFPKEAGAYVEKLTTAINMNNGDSWRIPHMGVRVPEMSSIVGSDEGGAVPTDNEGKARHGRKAVRAKVTPIKATAIPTYPSWKWSSLDTVWILGVGKNYEGQLEVYKVTLSYNRNGLHTSLELRKRTVGKKQGKNKNAKLPNGRDEGEDGTIDDPKSPRPVQEKLTRMTNIGAITGVSSRGLLSETSLEQIRKRNR